jgi:hypothetical protein
MKQLRLSGLGGAKLLNAQFMRGSNVSFAQDAEGNLVLSSPAALPNENDSVIELTLSGSAESLPLVEIK